MRPSLTNEVIISGIGQSDIGRRLGRDPLQLTVDACLAAVEDAGLTLADIDGLLRLVDEKGRRYVVRSAQIAYVEIAPEDGRKVGFAIG